MKHMNKLLVMVKISLEKFLMIVNIYMKMIRVMACDVLPMAMFYINVQMISQHTLPWQPHREGS